MKTHSLSVLGLRPIFRGGGGGGPQEMNGADKKFFDFKALP